jgi:hypothetical protein
VFGRYTIFLAQVTKLSEDSPANDFRIVDEQARKTNADIPPWNSGERSPHWRPRLQNDELRLSEQTAKEMRGWVHSETIERLNVLLASANY